MAFTFGVGPGKRGPGQFAPAGFRGVNVEVTTVAGNVQQVVARTPTGQLAALPPARTIVANPDLIYLGVTPQSKFRIAKRVTRKGEGTQFRWVPISTGAARRLAGMEQQRAMAQRQGQLERQARAARFRFSRAKGGA